MTFMMSTSFCFDGGTRRVRLHVASHAVFIEVVLTSRFDMQTLHQDLDVARDAKLVRTKNHTD